MTARRATDAEDLRRRVRPDARLAPRTAVAVAAVLALTAAGPQAASPQQAPPPDTARNAVVDTAEAPRAGNPAQAADGRGHAFLGGYALLAFEPSTGAVGAASATSGFSAGSGSLAVEAGRGAVALLGSGSEAARRAAVEALRADAAAGETTRAASGASGARGLQASALTTDCARSTRTSGEAYPWTGAREGTAGDVCFLAAGAFLADSTVVGRMSAAFRSAEGSLLDRLQAALAAAEDAAGDVARSRSAAIWISAPDAGSGALGRAHLRLQVEDVQRPADALRALVRAGRAEELARRASRAVDAGEHGRAVDLAERAVEIDPATPLAWLARGRSLLYRNQDEEAEEAFRRMLEINPHLLHLLGDPGRAARDTADETALESPEVREELIPYRPRLLLRLDEYRRAFFREVEFPEREDGAPEDDPQQTDGGREP